MNTSGKITALFVAVTSLLCTMAVGLVAVREYRLNLDQLVGLSSARTLGRGDLNYHVYRSDEQALDRILADFLESEAVAGAIALSPLGDVLSSRTRVGAVTQPSLAHLRGQHAATETVLVGMDRSGRGSGTSFWTSLFNRDVPLHLTLPMISSAHPAAKDLSPEDFAREVADPRSGPSLHVLGYIHLVIDRGVLLGETLSLVRGFLLFSAMLVAIGGAGVLYITRRITAPVAQLSHLADEIAAGTYQGRAVLEERGEFGQIAATLNTIIDGVTRRQQEFQVDRRLLSMKVEERSSQLSRRDQELMQVSEEVTETRNQLQRLSLYDSLTSLPNRQLFTEQMELLLSLNQRNREQLALLFVDLDNFRRVNASLGHSAGDQLLREVGQRLAAAVRNSDAVAHYGEAESGIEVSRLGGDEFTVVLNQLDGTESAGRVAARLIDTLCQPMIIQGQELVVSPSIGIATAPADADSVEGLLTAAGIAMHHAKSSSGASYRYYREDMGAARAEHLRLETDLRKAQQRGELALHYQPVIDTLTGAVVAAEALLRWEHPEHGEIPPHRFLPLAEETGLIEQLGEWVLVEACRQLKEFREQGLKLPRVAINVSTRQLSPAFAERVADALATSQLEPSSLELGLSAAAWMDSDGHAVDVLRELKELGVYLSVDDFGTAHTPLTYLCHYPLDAIKIDRSLVVDCHNIEGSGKLVAALISMANSMGLQVVAEGVETPEQFHFLGEWGARVIQGYLLSKPVPAEQLKPRLAPWHFVEPIQALGSVEAA